MALKLRKNSKQPRVLPDLDPAGLVLVEPLVLYIHPLILLISEHLTLEVAGREVLREHARGFDLRAPTTEEGKNCFAKDVVIARDFTLALARASRNISK